MRKLLLLTMIIILAGCKAPSIGITPAGYFNVGGKFTYQDDDWNLEFYDNCGMPNSSSAQWITEGKETFLRFTLKNRDIGLCGPDAPRVPYRERAEIKQTTYIERGIEHTLTFRFRIIKGFNHYDESIMQIKQVPKHCHKPLFKMLFDYGSFRWRKPFKVSRIIGKWVDVKMHFNEDDQYDIYFDGKPVVKSGYFWLRENCGTVYLKFGIYRHGEPGSTEERISILDIDKIKLVEGKK